MKRTNPVYRFLHVIYRWRPVSWLLSIILPPLDKFFFKITKGRLSFARVAGGLPVRLIHCKGAKSGIERTNPLIAIPDGEEDKDLILIASNWGGKKNPSWYYNLKAHPEIKVTINGIKEPYQAIEVDEDSYDEFWDKAVAMYSGYNNYKKRTNRKKIPILLLQPIKVVDQ